MYRIGVFSKISKTTVKTLRYYNEIGLLVPEFVDNENGYRYYTTKQLVQLHKIISLRQIGLSIDEISAIIKNYNVDEILEQRKNEILTQIKESENQLSRINHYILEKKEGILMNYQAVVKEIPECIVYSKRMTVPNYDSYFQIIPAIGEEVKAVNPNLKCTDDEYCFIIYHDGEYRENDINIEFCETVTEMGNETDTIKFKKMPKITVISVMHKGAYKNLRDAYAYVFKWIEDNGYSVVGNPRESFIDGIWNKDTESDWLTELQIPIVKK